MHQIYKIGEHEGMEEYLCEQCGRHLLVLWHPKFKRVVINSGDESAGHLAFAHDVDVESNLNVPTDTDLKIFDDFIGK